MTKMVMKNEVSGTKANGRVFYVLSRNIDNPVACMYAMLSSNPKKGANSLIISKCLYSNGIITSDSKDITLTSTFYPCMRFLYETILTLYHKLHIVMLDF